MPSPPRCIRRGRNGQPTAAIAPRKQECTEQTTARLACTGHNASKRCALTRFLPRRSRNEQNHQNEYSTMFSDFTLSCQVRARIFSATQSANFGFFGVVVRSRPTALPSHTATLALKCALPGLHAS